MYYILILLILFFCFINIQCNHQFHSCIGYCNSNLYVENSCLCNDDCLHKNNCCFNFLMVCSNDSNFTNNTIQIKDINMNNVSNKIIDNLNQKKSYYLRKNTLNNIYTKSFYLNIFLVILLLILFMYIKNRNY